MPANVAMRHVDYFGLSRIVQDQFAESARGESPPPPLLYRPVGARAQLAWGAVAGLGVLSLAFLEIWGFGDLGSPAARHAPALLLAYVVLAALVVVGTLRALAIARRTRALPYAPGIYVFPAQLIDAQGTTFRVFPLEEMTSIDVVAEPKPAVRLRFGASGASGASGDEAFVFEVETSDRAGQVSRAIAASRDEVREARAADDRLALQGLEPLEEPRFSNPFAPLDPLEDRTPVWARWTWSFGLILGAVLGPALRYARDAASDDRMFAIATTRNDSLSLRAYLRRGQRHRDVVERFLLPRSELKDAEREGTVRAIERYASTHPRSAIQQEVTASLRAAMLAELATARGAGGLPALEEFARRHPSHDVDRELREAIHDVYARATETYRANAPAKTRGGDDRGVRAMEGLLAWAEAEAIARFPPEPAPTVTLRFRRLTSRSLTRADKFVIKNPSFLGETSYPSRYFDPAHFAGVESELARVVIERFVAAIPPELLRFQVGPTLDEAEPIPPGAPTLVISHAAEWSGAAYASNRDPRGVYVGIRFEIEAYLAAVTAGVGGGAVRPPKDTDAFRFRVEASVPVVLTVLKERPPTNESPSASNEDRIYAAMTRTAFREFETKLLALFFRPPDAPGPR